MRGWLGQPVSRWRRSWRERRRDASAERVAGTANEHVLVGRSVQKRPIDAVQIGDPAGSRVALVVGVIHGDEPGGLRILRAIKRRAADERAALQGTQLWAIETVNPDGLRAHTRKNAHGVDLNRNYPYRWQGDVPHSNGYYPGPRPASEPETRAVMAFVRRIQPDLSVWYHQPWGAVLACRGRPPIAAEYAKLVGMRHELQGQGPARHGDHLGDARVPGEHRLRGRDASGEDQRRHGRSPGACGPDRRGGPLR